MTFYRPRRRVQFKTTGPSRTKQEFRDECDINKIMSRYEKTGILNHVNKYQGQYGDFSNVTTYEDAFDQLQKANEMFMTLPARVREKFQNEPQNFIKYMEDPKFYQEQLKLGLRKHSPEQEKKIESQKATKAAKAAASAQEKSKAADKKE